MITIFSTSKLSSIPSQAVSTIRLNIFKRISDKDITYWTDTDNQVVTSGSIKRIPPGKNKYLQYLKKIYWMHKTKPDIVLFTGEFLEIILYILRPRGATTVLHLNGPLHESAWTYPYRNFSYIVLWYSVAFFVKRAQAVITITNYTANTVRKIVGSKPLYVIYNGVDITMFSRNQNSRDHLWAAFGIEPKKPLVVYAGSLIARKRPDLVVEIAKLCPHITFVLVGAVSPELNMANTINEAGNIQIIPFMKRDDIAKLFGSADVFCFPALYEGFGMVVAEAMASGCPPVVSAGSGPEEIVSHGKSGFTIPRNENRATETAWFVEKIQSILSNKELQGQFRKNAQEQARLMFEWGFLAKQWKNALQEINLSISKENKN